MTTAVKLFPPDGIQRTCDIKAAAAAMAYATLFAAYAAAAKARLKQSKEKRSQFYVAVHLSVLVVLAGEFVASARKWDCSKAACFHELPIVMFTLYVSVMAFAHNDGDVGPLELLIADGEKCESNPLGNNAIDRPG
jgi:hypothetical protein